MYDEVADVLGWQGAPELGQTLRILRVEIDIALVGVDLSEQTVTLATVTPRGEHMMSVLDSGRWQNAIGSIVDSDQEAMPLTASFKPIVEPPQDIS